MSIGFSSSPVHPTPPLQKCSTMPRIMVLPKCYPTRLFWTTPHPYPHFYQEHPRHKKWISILTQKLTLFVLFRTFWCWIKTEWRNKYLNNSHSVSLNKWTNLFYIFFVISEHLSRKKAVSCSSFMALVDFSLKIQNNWFNFWRLFWGLSNFSIKD